MKSNGKRRYRRTLPEHTGQVVNLYYLGYGAARISLMLDLHTVTVQKIIAANIPAEDRRGRGRPRVGKGVPLAPGKHGNRHTKKENRQ